MTRTLRPALVFLAALLAAGCVSKSEFVAKTQEADRLGADLTRERQRSGELAVLAAQVQTRLAETESRLESALKERETLRGELTESRTQAARLAGQLAEATDQRDTLARQLDIAQQSASQKDVSLQQVTYRYDDLIKDLERQKGELARRLTDLGGQLAAAEGRIKGLSAERDTLTAERLRLGTRLGELDVELTTARQRLGDSQGELAATRQRLGETESELAGARQRLVDAESELGGTRQRLADAETALAAERQRVADVQAELTSTRARLGETRAELEARERKLAETTATYDQLVADLKGEIADGQVKITQLRDRLTVNLVDKILFDSGSTAINPRGQQVLKKVAEVLRPIADKRIQIEGHTDNVPISSSLQGRFPTNWELSVARATVVARFLQDQGAIEPARLLATGYGEHHPIAGNDTLEGRAQNRRIEIVLVPNVTETAAR